MKRFFPFVFGVLWTVATIAWCSRICQAQITYPTQTFTFDTSALGLEGYIGPFQLDFQLTDGSGTLDGNTSLTVDNFLVDGVSQPSILPVSMTDNLFFSEEIREITPGSLLSFDLSGSYGVDGDAPDLFSFTILDGNGDEVHTTSPAGGLLLVNFDNENPSAVSTAQFQIVSANAAPEPGTLALLLCVSGIGSAFVLRRYQK